jgi:deoxycytidylate deaminase
VPEVRERSYVLDPEKFPQTVARYKKFFLRVLEARFPKNPLFDDEIYRQCFFAALDSDCAKRNFGCIFVKGGAIVHADANRKIPEIAHRCEPVCIRMDIASRTDSMVGACRHAEEGIWDVVHRGMRPEEVELYVAGFENDGTPWMKKSAEHTCLRCAVSLHLAKVKAIHVPVVDHWETVSPDSVLDTAFDYALAEKNV